MQCCDSGFHFQKHAPKKEGRKAGREGGKEAGWEKEKELSYKQNKQVFICFIFD